MSKGSVSLHQGRAGPGFSRSAQAGGGEFPGGLRRATRLDEASTLVPDPRERSWTPWGSTCSNGTAPEERARGRAEPGTVHPGWPIGARDPKHKVPLFGRAAGGTGQGGLETRQGAPPGRGSPKDQDQRGSVLRARRGFDRGRRVGFVER